MGIIDLVPGISGGTIALVMGIYERLMHSLKAITNPIHFFHVLTMVKKKQFMQGMMDFIRVTDGLFLFVLFLGIISASLFFSKLMVFLFDHFRSYTMSLFVGLILISGITIFEHIHMTPTRWASSTLGFVLGILFLLFEEATVLNPSPWFLFFGGFVGMFAMFLPGISGSFVLLVLGLYYPIVSYFAELTFDPFGSLLSLLPYFVGIVTGIIVVSRVVSYLFKKNKALTLSFLVGLVLGSLSVPLKIIAIEQVVDPQPVWTLIAMFVIGCLLVLGLYSIRSNETHQHHS